VGAWISLVLSISLLALLRLRRIVRTVRVPTCAGCGYSLAGLPADACCPECNSGLRVRTVIRRRTLVLLVFGRLPLVWAVFLVVPPLWASSNLLGTAWWYARVEGFEAGWRNASVGISEAYSSSGWLFEEFAPCCAAIAAASMVWPKRLRWWVATALVAWMAWLAWTSVSSWHRHPGRDAPNAHFVLLAAAVLAVRAAVLYQTRVIVQLRTEGPR